MLSENAFCGDVVWPTKKLYYLEYLENEIELENVPHIFQDMNKQ